VSGAGRVMGFRTVRTSTGADGLEGKRAGRELDRFKMGALGGNSRLGFPGAERPIFEALTSTIRFLFPGLIPSSTRPLYAFAGPAGPLRFAGFSGSAGSGEAGRFRLVDDSPASGPDRGLG
jgi:hypothetical protein